MVVSFLPLRLREPSPDMIKTSFQIRYSSWKYSLFKRDTCVSDSTLSNIVKSLSLFSFFQNVSESTWFRYVRSSLLFNILPYFVYNCHQLSKWFMFTILYRNSFVWSFLVADLCKISKQRLSLKKRLFNHQEKVVIVLGGIFRWILSNRRN